MILLVMHVGHKNLGRVMEGRTNRDLILNNLNLVNNIDPEQSSIDATHFQQYSEKFRTMNANGELYRPENLGEVRSRASRSGSIFAKNFSA